MLQVFTLPVSLLPLSPLPLPLPPFPQNVDVLRLVTGPNVRLNADTEAEQRVRLLGGDWAAVAAALTAEGTARTFDLVLTSETIYSPASHGALLDLLDTALAADGVALVASKIYYFGVGGGTRQFEDKIEQHGVFSSSVCFVCKRTPRPRPMPTPPFHLDLILRRLCWRWRPGCGERFSSFAGNLRQSLRPQNPVPKARSSAYIYHVLFSLLVLSTSKIYLSVHKHKHTHTHYLAVTGLMRLLLEAWMEPVPSEEAGAVCC